MRDWGPILTSERDELAHQRRPQSAGFGLESVWHDVAWDDRHAKSGAGKGGGGRDLIGVHDPSRGEARSHAHFTIRDGVFVKWEVFFDRKEAGAEALEAAGLPRVGDAAAERCAARVSV